MLEYIHAVRFDRHGSSVVPLNISTRTYNPTSSSVFVGGGGVGRPETRLVYTVPTQIMDRNKLGV